MAHEKDPPGAFRIGIGPEDLEGIAVRVFHIEANRAPLSDESLAESREVIIPKRVVAADLGEVTRDRAELKVLDAVTIGDWRFKVGVEGTFTFLRQPSRWELEGPEARRMLVGLLLSQTCEVIAYLTSKVGMRPLILAPAMPDEG